MSQRVRHSLVQSALKSIRRSSSFRLALRWSILTGRRRAIRDSVMESEGSRKFNHIFSYSDHRRITSSCTHSPAVTDYEGSHPVYHAG